jgi:hypothetical protein
MNSRPNPIIVAKRLLGRFFTLNMGSIMTTFALTLAAIGLGTRATWAYEASSSFGGPAYVGSADLPVEADLIQAGGGPGSFSMIRAWDNMIGADAMQTDLTRLTNRYGRHATDQFVRIFDFAVSDAWDRDGMDNIGIPTPSSSSGRVLALAILGAARAPGGQLWMKYLFGHILSPEVYSQVSTDIDNAYGVHDDARFNRMTDRFLGYVAEQDEMAPVS